MPLMRRRTMRRRKPSSRVKRGRLARKNKMTRQVHWFKRTCRLADITASVNTLGVGTPINAAYQFNLAQLPNVSEFTTLFDQFKITGARLSFVPGGNVATVPPLSGTSSAYGFSRFNSVIDFDDSTAPATENDLLQYGSLKTTPPMRPHHRYLKPKMLQEIYQSAVSTAYAPTNAPWLDVGNSGVPHYGVKIFVGAPLAPSGTASSITYNVYLTLYFGCKNVR